jgi:hypothetical protein
MKIRFVWYVNEIDCLSLYIIQKYLLFSTPVVATNNIDLIQRSSASYITATKLGLTNERRLEMSTPTTHSIKKVFSINTTRDFKSALKPLEFYLKAA